MPCRSRPIWRTQALWSERPNGRSPSSAGLDLPVNSAATDVPGPVEHLAVEDWDRVLAVNLRAPFLLSKLAFPRMRRRAGGRS